MKELVVRAGKYAAVGIIVVASLPVVIPSLMVLSFFGFTFVLPAGCALMGFLYIQKHAGMLYRKLPLIGSARSPGGISPGNPREAVTFSALSLKDVQSIELHDDVDQEFDAVVVSTGPHDVQESEGGYEASNGKPSTAFSVQTGSLSEGEVMQDGEAETDPIVGSSLEEEFADAVEGDEPEGMRTDTDFIDDRSFASVLREENADSAEGNEQEGKGPEADFIDDHSFATALRKENDSVEGDEREGKGLEADFIDDRSFATVLEGENADSAEDKEHEGKMPELDFGDDRTFASVLEGEEKEQERNGTEVDFSHDRSFAGALEEGEQGQEQRTSTEDLEPPATGQELSYPVEDPEHVAEYAASDLTHASGVENVEQAEERIPAQDMSERRTISAGPEDEFIPVRKDKSVALTDEGDTHDRLIVMHDDDEKTPVFTNVEDKRSENVFEVLTDEGALQELNKEQEGPNIDARDRVIGTHDDGEETPVLTNAEDKRSENVFEVLTDEGALQELNKEQEGPNIDARDRVIGTHDDGEETPVLTNAEDKRSENVFETLTDEGAFQDLNKEQEGPNIDSRDRVIGTHDDGEETPVLTNAEDKRSDDVFEALTDEGALQELNKQQEGAEFQSPISKDPIFIETGEESKEDVVERGVERKEDKLAAPLYSRLDEERDESPISPASNTSGYFADSPHSPSGDHAANLLPHQANQDDIWICRDCGWKYPNAKPSAKIRRNHKKHCKGPSSPASSSSSTAVAAEGEMLYKSVVGESSRGIDSGALAPEPKLSPYASLESRMGEDESVSIEEVAAPSARDAEEAEEGGNAVHSLPSEVPGIGDYRPATKSVAFDEGSLYSAPSGGLDEDLMASESFRSASESFRSAPDAFADLDDEERTFSDQEHHSSQVQEELEVQADVNALKRVLGDMNLSRGGVLSELEEISEVIGFELPARSADVPDTEWARVSVEVLKVIVGME